MLNRYYQNKHQGTWSSIAYFYYEQKFMVDTW